MRYLRLYWYFVKFSLSRAMEFRLDFYFRVVMDLLYYAVNIFFFRIIFLHTPVLGGWSQSQVMVFVAGYLVLDALNMTLFSNNMWWLPTFVNKGDLDYYLTRPVSSLFFLSLRDFAANSFINLLMAVAILVWALTSGPERYSAGKITLFSAGICAGTFIYYSVRLLTLLTVFWTHSSRGMDQLFWPLTRFMERPDRIFTGVLRFILVTVLPFALMASYPARLILDPFDWKVVIHLFGGAIVLFALLMWCWDKALKNYASASS